MAEADALLGGRLQLRQPATGHRAGTDAILLAAACVPAGDRLGDIGAGIGTAGLAAALRLAPVSLLLVEREAELADLAQNNAQANMPDLSTRVVACDVLSAKARREAGLANGCLDDVIANPPWYAAREARRSPDRVKARAYTMPADDVVQPWLRAAAALLRPGGSMTMIHRAERLGDIVTASVGRFGALCVMPIHARAEQAAIRILVRAIKGSRAPLAIAPAFVLHGEDGRFTQQAEAVHRGEAAMAWPL